MCLPTCAGPRTTVATATGWSARTLATSSGSSGQGYDVYLLFDRAYERTNNKAAGEGGLGLEPGLTDSLVLECVNAAARQEAVGAPPVLLVPEKARNHRLRLFQPETPWHVGLEARFPVATNPSTLRRLSWTFRLDH